jgi:hypothetical protein
VGVSLLLQKTKPFDHKDTVSCLVRNASAKIVYLIRVTTIRHPGRLSWSRDVGFLKVTLVSKFFPYIVVSYFPFIVLDVLYDMDAVLNCFSDLTILYPVGLNICIKFMKKC